MPRDNIFNQIFSKVYCLNQASRPDRWAQAQTEFDRVGIKVERFLSIPADHPHKSFCLSQYAMLKTFLGTEGTGFLALEDDVIFHNSTHLPTAIGELPQDWDILYLGANITDMVFGIKENPPVKYSEHLHWVRRAWMTHAVAYSRKAVERIVQEYPVESFNMFDNWMSENMLPSMKAFLINPMICWQRPGKSDLWNTEADYTGCFPWGDKFMQS